MLVPSQLSIHYCCECHYPLQTDHMISYLPLSHIAAQMMDIHAPLHTGLTIHFAQPDAMKGSLAITLKVPSTQHYIVSVANAEVKIIFHYAWSLVHP